MVGVLDVLSDIKSIDLLTMNNRAHVTRKTEMKAFSDYAWLAKRAISITIRSAQ